jgi:hypothetical protein
MEANKLKTKDIITVVLLSLINIVIFMSGTFLYATPITLLLMPIYYALLEGMVVFTIGVKVRKRGAMLIYCAIQGVIGFYLPYTFTYIFMGIISEVILSKTGYDNAKGLTASYILQQVGLCFGSTIYPYVFAIKETMEMMSVKESANLKYIMTHAGQSIMNWGWIVLLIATAIVAYIGSLLGKRVVRKHILKAEGDYEDEN